MKRIILTPPPYDEAKIKKEIEESGGTNVQTGTINFKMCFDKTGKASAKYRYFPFSARKLKYIRRLAWLGYSQYKQYKSK